MRFLSFLFLTLTTVVHAATASLTPVQLQCEYRVEPAGLDERQPRLTWEVQSNERDQAQTAYEILVASSPELLQKDHGDRWSSGRVPSDETANIKYAGQSLNSGDRCFWKVRVWDQAGRASDWSAPGSWTMGLLSASDWHGKWIGLDSGARTNDFAGAQWIWFPDGDPANRGPVCARYFRRVFELPADVILSSATMDMTADDQFRLYVNGEELGHGDNWRSPVALAPARLLKPGKNIFAVEARNVGNQPNPAGVICKLKVGLGSGQTLVLNTDGAWKSATNAESGWQRLDFNDLSWTPAQPLGAYGGLTWETIDSPDRRLPARYLRREFSLDKDVRHATAYVCGLGLFELDLNGAKVSDDVLAPALSEYDKRAFYRTYEVTSQLRRGANAMGVILGNGRFFAPRSGTRSYGYPKLRLQLNIEYTDGTTAEVVSDEHWKLNADGAIGANNEYDGEEYDARKEWPRWCQPKFDDSRWQPAQVVAAGAPVLSAQIGEPIRVVDTLKPLSVTNVSPGVYIFDLGQNMVGWCRLKVSGPAGTVVKLRHGEVLKPDGTLYTDNLRSARAEDTYTLKGNGAEEYEPRFTYHGFRYVEVTGYPGEPRPEAIEGKLVHDALPGAGNFASSNPLLNRIYHNIYWTTRDNYRSMPTDLPRDEREGWMGDRQELAKGETYLFKAEPLYAQWLADIQDDQRTDGSVPDVCPAYWPLYQDGIVWASTYQIVPDMLYTQYADLGILRKHYDSMAKWIDYMTHFLENDVMPRNTYADWCVPPRSAAEMTVINSTDPKLTTDGSLMSTAIFYHDLQLISRAARVLGKADDAARFDALAARMKTAFNARFYKADVGYYGNGTQTACVLPLAFGMVPDDQKSKVFAQLVEKITVESDNHLGTGLIGGHYLMRVLSDNGRADLAYAIATQTTYPSWGYMISKGATTMWELWNGDTADAGMNSRNIVMLIGDLNIWLHEYIGGIRPAAPGFKQIVIKPEPVGDLAWARVEFSSLRGPIRSEWHRSANEFDLQVAIPPNTTATVFLPAKDTKSVTEAGKNVVGAPGVKSAAMEAGRAKLQLGSGNYHFVSRW